MKAAVIREFGSPDVFEITDIEKPVLAEDQLLVKVEASSINPIDWKQRKGNHRLIMGKPFPIVLGYDVSGVVVETGNKVTQFKKGDMVFGVLDNKYGGALAEYTLGHEKCFAIKPQSLTHEQSAAVPLVSLTALQALRDKVKLQGEKTILINGASGGVGHVVLQMAKLMEAKIYAVASYRNRDFVLDFEPDEFIDYTKEDIMNLDLKFDVFFDVAGKYSFPKCRHLLNKHGKYINTLPRPKMLIHKLLQPFTRRKKLKAILMKHNSDDLRTIAEWIDDGKLTVHVDEVFNLTNISAAHAYAQEGHNKGKNVVVIS